MGGWLCWARVGCNIRQEIAFKNYVNLCHGAESKHQDGGLYFMAKRERSSEESKRRVKILYGTVKSYL